LEFFWQPGQSPPPTNDGFEWLDFKALGYIELHRDLPESPSKHKSMPEKIYEIIKAFLVKINDFFEYVFGIDEDRPYDPPKKLVTKAQSIGSPLARAGPEASHSTNPKTTLIFVDSNGRKWVVSSMIIEPFEGGNPPPPMVPDRDVPQEHPPEQPGIYKPDPQSSHNIHDPPHSKDQSGPHGDDLSPAATGHSGVGPMDWQDNLLQTLRALYPSTFPIHLQIKPVPKSFVYRRARKAQRSFMFLHTHTQNSNGLKDRHYSDFLPKGSS
jgi:hypothetical protein